MDAFRAKDILERFRLQRRASFLRFARPGEVSRTTISNDVAALEVSFVAHLIRPFSSRRQHGIVAA